MLGDFCRNFYHSNIGRSLSMNAHLTAPFTNFSLATTLPSPASSPLIGLSLTGPAVTILAQKTLPEMVSSTKRTLPRSSGLANFNLPESVPTSAPIAQFGMNKVREQFYTIYDARAGPGEVSVGVHGEDAVI